MPPTERLPKLRLTKEDRVLVAQIVDRAVRMGLIADDFSERLEVTFLLSACHLNGCPLNLRAMVDWERDFDVAHDIHGLNKHLDRRTGKLLHCFCPRFALPEGKVADG